MRQERAKHITHVVEADGFSRILEIARENVRYPGVGGSTGYPVWLRTMIV